MAKRRGLPQSLDIDVYMVLELVRYLKYREISSFGCE
jgi:hypothetical protein